MVKGGLVLLFLGINVYSDLKTRLIFLWTIPVFSIGGVVFWILEEQPFLSCITSLLPGLFLLILGKLTEEAMGLGDGLVVLVAGMYIGMWSVCQAVLGGLFLSSLWSAVLLARKGWSRTEIRKQSFPWLPCLFLSCVGRMVIEI